MVGGRLVAVAAGFCAGIGRMVKPGIPPTILVVARTTLPLIMPGRGVRQVALLAIPITAVIKIYFLPGVAVVTICACSLVMSGRRLKVMAGDAICGRCRVAERRGAPGIGNVAGSARPGIVRPWRLLTVAGQAVGLAGVVKDNRLPIR